jgi:cytochrome c553
VTRRARFRVGAAAFAAALLATGSLAALAAGGGPAGDAQRGSQIAANGTAAGAPPCASCHGSDGGGNADPLAPRLAAQVADYLRKELDDYANGARQNDMMTPIAQAMQPQDRADAAAFYAGLPPLPPPPTQTDAAKLRRGEMLATVGSEALRVEGCDNCHGPQGTGLPPAIPYLAGQFAPYMTSQYQAWRQGTRANDPDRVMATIFGRLEAADVDALGQYFASRGAAGPAVAEGSSTAH